MNFLQVDAVKIEPRDYLPAAVRASDGHAYAVLGVVTHTMTCSFPVEGPDVKTLGRRLCLLLGERLPDRPTADKVVGYLTQGSGA